MKRALLLFGLFLPAIAAACSSADDSAAPPASGDGGSDAGLGDASFGGGDGSTGSGDGGGGTDGGSGPRVMLGVYSDTFQSLNASIVGATGRGLAIENQRETWGSPMNKADEDFDRDAGIIPLLSWAVAYRDPDAGSGNTCAHYREIVKGDFDDTWIDSGGTSHPGLKQEADTVKSWGVPVMIRFFKEFTNTEIDSCFYGSGHPADDPQTNGPMLVGVWQHVVDVFKAEGADNVQWVWGPSAGLFGDGPTPDDTTWRYFWPGSNYVDWISNDNYNKSDTDASAYADDQNIRNWYAVTSKLGKPLMQCETGAGYGGDDAGSDPMNLWLTSAYATVKNDMPEMKAFLWWSSEGQVDYNLQGQDLTLFETMVKDPVFQASSTSGYFTSKGASGGPTMPTAVSAAWAGADVNVSWTASTDAFGSVTAYTIYRDGAVVGTSGATSFVDTGVPAGPHKYTVDAMDSALNRSQPAMAFALATQ